MSEPVELTSAQMFVHAELAKLLAPGSRWRAGAIILSYRTEAASDRECNIANAIGMQNEGCALDIVMLIKRLRGLANELEEVVQGKRPLPAQPERKRHG